MYFTGISDEAARGIDGQIKAFQELGWNSIEARNINDVNIIDLPDAEFDVVAGKLSQAGIKLCCFSSAIANWGKQIMDPAEASLTETRHAIPRMQKLGTKLVRIMSYAVIEDRHPDDQLEEMRFNKLREIKKMFDDAGITAVHENCMNFGGMSWQHTLRLLEHVPGLKLVFDTGNPVFNADRSQTAPYPRQSSWEFYNRVKRHIQHVHIKDCIWNHSESKVVYTFPGQGQGNVFEIVADLLKNKYDGGFSIEPHMAEVFHDRAMLASDESKYAIFIEYGRRFEHLANKARIAASEKTQ